MSNAKLLSQQHFDRQAASYDAASFSLHARRLYPIFLSQLCQLPHKNILDVGCGTGALLELILEHLPDAKCAGLDLSPNMVQRAQDKLGNRANILLGDSQSLPFSNESFDVVVCNDSFHHYSAPTAVLHEIYRVLRPGGVFLLGETTAPAPVRLASNLLLPFSHAGDVRLYSSQELIGLFSPIFHGTECKRVNATSLFGWGIK